MVSWRRSTQDLPSEIRPDPRAKRREVKKVTQSLCNASDICNASFTVTKMSRTSLTFSSIFSARPVDLRRSRTRTNIPVQKIMEAQNAVDGQHNAIDINIDDQPVAPSRRKKDDRRGGGGEKSGEGLEDEAQDILERLKKL